MYTILSSESVNRPMHCLSSADLPVGKLLHLDWKLVNFDANIYRSDTTAFEAMLVWAYDYSPGIGLGGANAEAIAASFSKMPSSGFKRNLQRQGIPSGLLATTIIVVSPCIQVESKVYLPAKSPVSQHHVSFKISLPFLPVDSIGLLSMR